MKPNFILTDSCYWLGLLDSSDQHHKKSITISKLIEEHTIVIPWPCMYETVSTSLVRKRQQVTLLEQLLSGPNIQLLDDKGYRELAFEEVLNANRMGKTHSLTDVVIREILKDINVKIDFLVTYNEKDFLDLCMQRKIEILSED